MMKVYQKLGLTIAAMLSTATSYGAFSKALVPADTAVYVRFNGVSPRGVVISYTAREGAETVAKGFDGTAVTSPDNPSFVAGFGADVSQVYKILNPVGDIKIGMKRLTADALVQGPYIISGSANAHISTATTPADVVLARCAEFKLSGDGTAVRKSWIDLTPEQRAAATLLPVTLGVPALPRLMDGDLRLPGQ